MAKVRKTSKAPRTRARTLGRPGLLARVQSRRAGAAGALWTGPGFQLPKGALSSVAPHPSAGRDRRFKDALVQSNPNTITAATPDDLLAIDTATMSVGFCISSPALDRHGDNVLVDGYLSTVHLYDANPQVFFAHKSEGFPIARAKPKGAKAASLWIDGGKLYSRAYFHGKTEESTDVFRLIEAEILNAASIGFVPLRGRLREGAFDDEAAESGGSFDFDFGGVVFEEWQLLEYSVVPIPANADALRGWLDPSKRLAHSLRKSLAPYASKRRVSLFIDRPRAPSPMRKKNSGSPPPEPTTDPAEQKPDEGRIDKADVQCIEFDVSMYPDEASCKTWLEANGFDDVEMTPDHGGGDQPKDVGSLTGPKAFDTDEPEKVDDPEPPKDGEGDDMDDGDPKNLFFCLFSDKECEPDSHKIEEVEQGVKFHTCKRAKDKPKKPKPGASPDEGPEEGPGEGKEPTGGDSYDKDDEGDDGVQEMDEHPEPDADDAGGKPDGDADDMVEKETLRPYGAEVLTCIAHHFEDVREYLEEAVQVLEHPKVLKYCEKLLQVITKQVDDVKAFGTATYPDHFDEPAPSGDGSIDHDEGDDGEREEAEDEDDSDMKSLSAKAKLRFSKALNKKQAAVVTDAAEFLEELATEDNLKKSQKAASRMHGEQLRSLSKAESGQSNDPPQSGSAQAAADVEPDDAEVRQALAAVRSLSAQLESLEERYYEQTGSSIFHD